MCMYICIVHTKQCDGFPNYSQQNTKKFLLLEINTTTKFKMKDANDGGCLFDY